MNQIAGWWDGLELWVIGLPYVPQLLLVMAVALPAAYAVARICDVVLARALALLGRDGVSAPVEGVTAGER